MALMLLYRKHRKFDGEICLLYLGGYGLGRFWIEGIRTDQLYFAGTTIPVSQLLALIFVVVSLTADIIIRLRMKKNAEKTEKEAELN